VLKWPAWTGKPSRPVEQSGKEHDCPKFVRSTKKSMYNVDIWETYEPTIKYYFCGKCNTLCENQKEWRWCNTCKMYPQITNSGTSEKDGEGFKPDPNVKPVMSTNSLEIDEEFRTKHGDNSPTNAVHMNNDGSIKKGYKLTEELVKWFETGGKDIIIDMNSKIWYKQKEYIKKSNVAKGKKTSFQRS